MADGSEIFELDYLNGKIVVEQVSLPGQVFFRVQFSDNIEPLNLLRARDFNQVKFWTSMPEGRQKLAQEIGPLIEQYYRTQKK